MHRLAGCYSSVIASIYLVCCVAAPVGAVAQLPVPPNRYIRMLIPAHVETRETQTVWILATHRGCVAEDTVHGPSVDGICDPLDLYRVNHLNHLYLQQVIQSYE